MRETAGAAGLSKRISYVTDNSFPTKEKFGNNYSWEYLFARVRLFLLYFVTLTVARKIKNINNVHHPPV